MAKDDKERAEEKSKARRDMRVRAGHNRTGPRKASWNNLAKFEELQRSREED